MGRNPSTQAADLSAQLAAVCVQSVVACTEEQPSCINNMGAEGQGATFMTSPIKWSSVLNQDHSSHHNLISCLPAHKLVAAPCPRCRLLAASSRSLAGLLAQLQVTECSQHTLLADI